MAQYNIAPMLREFKLEIHGLYIIKLQDHIQQHNKLQD
jgi:hypothetical protein